MTLPSSTVNILRISSPITEPTRGMLATTECFCLCVLVMLELPEGSLPSLASLLLATHPDSLSGFQITERLLRSDIHLMMGLIISIRSPSTSRLGQITPLSCSLGVVLTTLPFSLTGLPLASRLKFQKVGVHPSSMNQSFRAAWSLTSMFFSVMRGGILSSMMCHSPNL